MSPRRAFRLRPVLAAALWCSLNAADAAAASAVQDSDPDQVARLQALLRNYYAWEEQSLQQRLNPAERLALERAEQDARALAHLAYDPAKVQLSGAEGSLLLAEFTRRIYDPGIPDSQRDVAPSCAISTYLFGNLIAGEEQSFRPVGKYHYLLKTRLQPGLTTVQVGASRWKIQLPEDSFSREYLLALYHPPGGDPELHAFPVEELLSTRDVHLPPWLPDELGLITPG